MVSAQPVRGIPAVRSPDARLLNRVAVSYLSMAKEALKQTDIFEARAHAYAAHAIASTLSPSDLTTSRNVRSECHPVRIAAAAVLSDTYKAEGRFDDALGYAEQVAEHDVKVLGSTHPIAIDSTISLAATLASTGSAPEAERLLRQASDDLRQLSGIEARAGRAVTSPDCFKVDALLGRVLAMQGQLESATLVVSDNLEAARALYGERAPEYLRALADLGEVLLDRGLYAAAEPLLAAHHERCLEMYGPATGPEASKQTHLSGLRYADALEAQGKLLESANLLMNAFGRGHPRAIRVIAKLREAHPDQHDAQHAGCPGKASCSPEQRTACKTPC